MQQVVQLHSRIEERFGADTIRSVGVLAAAAALLTFLGPFGTRTELGPLVRVIYWAIAIGTGRIGAEIVDVFVKPRLLRSRAAALAPFAGVFGITVAALFAVLILEAVFREPVPPDYFLGLVLSVFVIALAVWGVCTLARQRHPEEAATDPAFQRFQASWPADLRAAQLRALAAEDHYVRVFTDRGEALVAGRFGEALCAVQSVAGSQVHRSWWVADAAVTGLRRSGGRWVVLGPGIEAPVSRRFRPNVRALGWDQRQR